MIIECPACSKKFNIDEKLIPDEGRLLKCGNCEHTWFFKKEEKTKLEAETTNTSKIEENKLSFGKVMPMLRIAITGKMAGPSLFETIELIGKEKFESRIIRIVNEIENGKNNS